MSQENRIPTDEEKAREILTNPIFWHNPGLSHELAYSATMEVGSTLDPARVFAKDPLKWQYLALKNQGGEKRRHIIISDPHCVRCQLHEDYEEHFFVLNTLRENGFSFSGLNSSGRLIPIVLEKNPYREVSDRQEKFIHEQFNKIAQLDLQAGHAVKIAQQLSAQGLDLQEFCILDARVLWDLAKWPGVQISPHDDERIRPRGSKLSEKDLTKLIIQLIIEAFPLDELSTLEMNADINPNNQDLLLSLLRKCPDLDHLELRMDRFLSNSPLWPAAKNITSLVLKLNFLTDFELSSSRLPKLISLQMVIDDKIEKFPVLLKTLESLRITSEALLRNHIYSKAFMDSTAAQLASLANLTILEVNFPIARLDLLSRKLTSLHFHCGALPSVLDFSSFPKLEELTIYYNPLTGKPKVTGFRKEPTFKPLEVKLIDQDTSEEEYDVDTSTYTPPETILTIKFHIRQRNAAGFIETFPADQVRQKVDDHFLSFSERNYIEGWDALGITRLSSKLREASLAPGEGFYGFDLEPTGDWQQLPRRFINDCITQMYAPADSEIRYNLQIDQYEILLKGSKPCFIQPKLAYASHGPHSLIRTFRSKALQPHQQAVLERIFPREISPELRLACFRYLFPYFMFGDEGNAALSGPPIFGQKYSLLDIIAQRKGACRHRAPGCAMVGQKYQIPTRPISNRIHAVFEYYDAQERRWYLQNLSGHDAQLRSSVAEDEESFDLSVWQEYFLPKIKSPREYKSLPEVFDHLTETGGWRIEMPDLASARNLHVRLHEYLKTRSPSLPICYVESTSELREAWRPSVIKEDGSLDFIPGYLQTVVKPAGGILLNILHGFTPEEIVSTHSLLDASPSFLGDSTAGLKVISVISPEFQACSAFFSRTNKFEWPADISLEAESAIPILHGKDEAPSPGVEAKSVRPVKRKRSIEGAFFSSESAPDSRILPCLSIDLYGDSNLWRSKLIGEPEFHEEGYGFTSGDLADPRIQSGNGLIELIDAPREDKRFQAFRHRSEVDKAVQINDKRIKLPDNFRWIDSQAPLTKTRATGTTELDNRETFYLNRRSFALLFKHQKLDTEDYLQQQSGWLPAGSKAGKHERPLRQIVQTQELTAGQIRRIAHFIEKHPDQDIHWVQLATEEKLQPKRLKSQTVSSSSSSSSSEAHFPASPSSRLVINSDPQFIAEQWRGQFDFIYPINQTTTISELLELIDLLSTEKSDQGELGLIDLRSHRKPDQKQTKKNRLKCTHQLQPVAQAFLAGKKVMLYGQLSEEVYLALETTFTKQPHLLLNKVVPAAKKLHPLTIITQNIDFATPLTPPQLIDQDLLWPRYESQLQKELGDGFKPDHWARLKLFYQMAEQMPAAVDMRISYTLLRSALQLLQKPCFGDGNPIKSLLHHYYPHDSEEHAYLNVLAKYLFGSTATPPGFRYEKFKKYENTPGYDWRRINCLNANALNRIFKLDRFKFQRSEPPILNWKKLEEKCPKIPPNPSPFRELIANLKRGLQQHRMIGLQGEPGTGKTHAALNFVKEFGQTFWAANEPELLKWLSSKTPGVLIVDEANLKKPGSLNFLRPLLASLAAGDVNVTYKGKTYAIPANHRVILTENFSGNKADDLLNEIPTLFVTPWTNQDLKDFIMFPLAKRILNKTTLDTHEKLALNDLLSTYRMMEKNLAGNQITIRDLQSVICRWAHPVKKARESGEIIPLYFSSTKEACHKEWSFRFIQPKKASQFKNFLQKKGEPGLISMTEDLSGFEEALEIPASAFLPTQPQQDIINIIIEDLELSLDEQLSRTTESPVAFKRAVLLEGDSGFGKSEVIKQALLQKNYRPATIAEMIAAPTGVDCPKRFIQFTSSGNYLEDSRLLEMAFDKGFVVILDELNISTELQELLHDLLTGKTPKGQPPTTPGFFLAASQNSGAHAGRRSLPTPLQNRFHVCYVKEHSEAELTDYLRRLLCYHVLDSCLARMAKAHVENRKEHSAEVNDRVFFPKAIALRQQLTEAIHRYPHISVQDKTQMLEDWIEQTTTVYTPALQIPDLATISSRFFTPAPPRPTISPFQEHLFLSRVDPMLPLPPN